MLNNENIEKNPCIKSKISAHSCNHLSQLINRFSWLAGVITTVLIPLLVLVNGYVMQHQQIKNEAAMLTAMFKQLELSNDSDATNLQTIEQMLNAASNNSPSEITISEKGINSVSGLIQKAFVIHFSDGNSALLTLSRSIYPIYVDAVIGLIFGLLLGILVFWASQMYPRKVNNLAIKELERLNKAEHRLRAANSLFSAILESTAEGIVAVDGEDRVVACNTRYLELWKLPENRQMQDSDYPFSALLASCVRSPNRFLETNQQLMDSPASELTECLELRDGRFFEWTSRPQRIQGRVVGRISTFRDISESKWAEMLLSTEKTVLEKIVQGASLKDALRVVVDAIERESGNIFCAILFCEDSRANNLDLVVGTKLPSWYRNQHLALRPCFGQRKSDSNCISLENPYEWFNTRSYRNLMEQVGVDRTKLKQIKGLEDSINGLVIAHYQCDSTISFERDEQLLQIASQLCSIAIDRYHSTQELNLLAHYDFLTNLPNRKSFHDHLKNAIDNALRTDQPLGLLFLDLDRFKAVNDLYGHAAGDAVLKVVASRIRESVREHDLVARLGGDEFVVLIEDLQNTEIASELASNIAERMTEGVNLQGRETFISVSVGIALYPKDGKTLEELLKNADTAMYEVKEQGRNGVQFFHARMNEIDLERLQLEEQLCRALERNEMTIHYQPKVQASNLEIIGAEALLRWHHPTQGLILPSKFVPLLEETGLIDDYWEWMIRKVCEDMQGLDQVSKHLLDIAVNVSARQFGKSSMRDELLQVIDSTGINPGRLELELTEDLLMKEPRQASKLLGELREIGVKGIAIDGFGTGFSSLAHLKGFPITALKIDRSFVCGIAQGNKDEAIAQAILALAKSLDLRVTAKGIETSKQVNSLTAQGCHEFQGYYFGKPVSLENFIRTLNGGLQVIDGKGAAEELEVVSNDLIVSSNYRQVNH